MGVVWVWYGCGMGVVHSDVVLFSLLISVQLIYKTHLFAILQTVHTVVDTLCVPKEKSMSIRTAVQSYSTELQYRATVQSYSTELQYIQHDLHMGF